MPGQRIRDRAEISHSGYRVSERPALLQEKLCRRPGEDGLDRAADYLAAHQAMVILALLDELPLFVLRNDPPLETKLTTATETA